MRVTLHADKEKDDSERKTAVASSLYALCDGVLYTKSNNDIHCTNIMSYTRNHICFNTLY